MPHLQTSFLISFVLGLLPYILFGQRLERLTVEDGLSQGFIIDAVQSRSGFMWFATLDGLNRYDGMAFKVFHPEAGRPASVPGNMMQRLLEDSRQFLWVLFDNELGFLDQRTEQFFFLPDSQVPPFLYLCEAPQGRMWGLSNSRMLYRLSFPSGKSRPEECLAALAVDSFPLPSPVKTGRVSCLNPMDTALWVGAENGIFEVSYATGRCTPVDDISLRQVSGIWRDTTDGAVWLFSGARLYRRFGGQMQAFQLENEPGVRLRRGVSNGRITCFFSQQRVYQWRDGQLRLLPQEIPDEIMSACIDRDGILWIGTNARGLRKIPLDHFYFDRHGPGISLNRQPLYDRDGQLWLSSSSFGAGRFCRYDPVGRRLSDTLKPGKNIAYLMQARAGRYWFISSEKELCQADRLDGRPVCHKLPQTEYFALLEDRRGNILLGSAKGALLRFDVQTQRQTEHTFAALLNNRTPVRVQAMAEDQAGRIWIGTTSGVVVATPREADQSYDFQRISAQLPAPKALTDDRVLAVLPDPTDSDICWVGAQHGLNRVDLRTGECRHFTQKDGLPNDVICSILPDGDHRIWLGTYFGLLEFDTRTYARRHFTTTDGLPCNEFNHQAALRLPDGRLFFGGVDGFTIFRPEDTRRSAHLPPRLCLTGLTIGTRKISPGDSTGILQASLSFTEAITLQHDQDNLTFHFALLDYFRAQGNHYFFRLRGFQDNWYDNGTSNQAFFFNVPAGSYVFEVIGSNSAGVQSEPVSLNITIRKPWWHTAWAYVFYSIVILVLIGTAGIIWLDRVRMNDQLQIEHREAARSRELEQFKSRLFSNYTHEFRTPLAIIRGAAEQLEHITRGTSRRLSVDIRQQADDMLRLTDQILDLTKMEEQRLHLHPEHTDLTDYLSRLCKRFISLAAEKRINCSWQLPADPVWVEVDVARLHDILTNLVSNALKFTGEGGSISLILQQLDDSEVQVTVRDTGIGIGSEDMEHIFDRHYQVNNPGMAVSGAGIGLSYVAELTRAMEGHIAVSSTPGQGSAFVLTLPVEPHYAARSAAGAGATQEEAVKEMAANPGRSEQPLLLIVEDNVQLAKLIAGQVSGHYSTEFAINGRAGLEKALEQVPDIVICDLHMPEMDGFEFCKALRSNTLTSHIPVVILTAYTDDPDRLKALQAGANAWLTKPVNSEILLQHLHNFMQLRRQMQQQILQKEQRLAPAAAERAIQTELEFMQQVNALIAKRYDDPNFTVTDIQQTLALSKSQLHRKLISISGHPANYFIRKYRLEEARKLLIGRAHLNVAEVAYRVGYADPNYFSRAFSAEFGKSPSEFRKDRG